MRHKKKKRDEAKTSINFINCIRFSFVRESIKKKLYCLHCAVRQPPIKHIFCFSHSHLNLHSLLMLFNITIISRIITNFYLLSFSIHFHIFFSLAYSLFKWAMMIRIILESLIKSFLL